jgi:hypothetical protein
VEEDVALLGHPGEHLDGVDDAVGVAGRRTHDEAGALGDGRFGGRHVGPSVGAHRHEHVLEVEVLGGLGEGRVRRGRGEELGLGDASLRSGVVAGHLHRQEDALGATRAHGAGVGLGAEELARHRDDVELHLQHARVLERIERVVVQVAEPDLLDQVFVLVIVDVVHEAERSAPSPVDVFGVSGLDVGEELLRRSAVLGDACGAAHAPTLGAQNCSKLRRSSQSVTARLNDRHSCSAVFKMWWCTSSPNAPRATSLVRHSSMASTNVDGMCSTSGST